MIENVCLCCGKKLRLECSLLEMIYVDDVICKSCRNRLMPYPKRLKLGKYDAFGIYPYEGFAREMMIQYKEYNDEALKSIFLYQQIKELRKKYHDYVIVPIPSSKENLAKRGFDQVSEIFSFLGLPIRHVLEKTQNVSQKELDYKERRNIYKILSIKNTVEIENKKVLLVDDILTTGNTLKAAIRLLEPYCKRVDVIVICYNKGYLNSWDSFVRRVNL